jgi:hypothetical protein
MYRHQPWRVACAICGVEQPIERMDFSPRGGHWCWRCQLHAQIAAHAPRGLYGTPPGPLKRIAHGAVIAVGVGAAVLLGGYAFLWLLAAALFRC